MTICALFLFAGGVFSKQSPDETAMAKVSEPFALKNPNAFDPARRRNVRAMKEPRQSAANMATGIDRAEADVGAESAEAADVQHASPRVAANAN